MTAAHQMIRGVQTGLTTTWRCMDCARVVVISYEPVPVPSPMPATTAVEHVVVAGDERAGHVALLVEQAERQPGMTPVEALYDAAPAARRETGGRSLPLLALALLGLAAVMVALTLLDGVVG